MDPNTQLNIVESFKTHFASDSYVSYNIPLIVSLYIYLNLAYMHCYHAQYQGVGYLTCIKV